MSSPINRRSFGLATLGTLGGAYVQRMHADQWTGWRGPARDGFCASALPTDLNGGLKELWSVPLGDSYSGPLVTADRVFVTETLDRKFETVKALERQTGKQVWEKRWEGAMSVPFFAKSNGDWIRSTPVTNGEVIVVGGMRDVLECLDVARGESRWRVDFNEQGIDLPAFGLVCSPLIDGDDLYVQAGGGVRKMSLTSGETEWIALEDKGGMNGGAFSSPIVAELGGVRQLVVQTRTTLAGVELAGGKVLWQQDIASFRGMNILTPTIWNESVYTSCYGGRSLLFSVEAGADGKWSVRQLWEGKAEAYMSSPVVVNDHLYLHLRNQRLCCVRLSDGAETWRSKPYGKYWSMVTDGKTILGLDETGMLYALRPNPEKLEILSEREVSNQPSWAHLAVADGQIFVRHQQGLKVLAAG